ncbi:Metallo-dependent phosphatase [Cylindrobasidium torrendii FP15055 ss-10]|uniref:Metallo-dependent phosphatase n=1 Tax=Cylindrobasidium torrendii FP15055 ss-10 TaxID=1314674 RepID=A0A0D7BSL1_9AGAR|nr:Metallo-dependent phosphatase [Cylindrobasidium torrendii FP15055 ss-10]
MFALSLLVTVTALSASAAFQNTAPFTAPGVFPTSLFAEYYNDPTATSAQVQPKVSDPAESGRVYALELTSPDTIPPSNTVDPHILPPKADGNRLYSHALSQIHSIASNPTFGDNDCARCQAGPEVAKFLALAAPAEVPTLAVQLCESFQFSTTCARDYSLLGLGSVITQVLAEADVGGLDGQMICQNFIGGLCSLAPTSPLNLTDWFAKPKPNPLPEPKQRSGERLKVLHVSDFHLDPRYATGSEANCTGGLCCRANRHNSGSPSISLDPAPRFGHYSCDSPYALVGAALQAIPTVTETDNDGFSWAIVTGDLVSHDKDNELSRDYIKYTEVAVFELLKTIVGTGAVYFAMGNHDEYNQAQDSPHAIGQGLSDQFSWNYDHLANLWEYEGWIDAATAEMAKKHYSAYSVQRHDGLRIITLNTDLWYKANYLNYINMSNPDTSGMLRFVTDELQDAEECGDRVWIIGHVLSGWDGSNPLLNPTNLFYQIVDRFTHVIANIFFGHTHEDQLSIFYAHNGTDISASTAGTVAWMGPSIVPITNLNSGFRMYEVDSATFEIMDAHTWRADVSSFAALDNQTAIGPIYEYEYNTREAYGGSIPGWSENDPLNATWWHLVTEGGQGVCVQRLLTTFLAMEANSSLVTVRSARTKECDKACIAAKICYIRSGSASLAKENCEDGYGSVQS